MFTLRDRNICDMFRMFMDGHMSGEISFSENALIEQICNSEIRQRVHTSDRLIRVKWSKNSQWNSRRPVQLAGAFPEIAKKY